MKKKKKKSANKIAITQIHNIFFISFGCFFFNLISSTDRIILIVLSNKVAVMPVDVWMSG